MPRMMTRAKEVSGPLEDRLILFASDSRRHGNSMHQAMQAQGLAVEYAGDYEGVGSRLQERRYDMVLLEVTGEHAVEPAVATALRVKRSNARQFVGYLADATLDMSGLAGDAVLPRSGARLKELLPRYFAGDAD
jgi:PleD family two-component response regulator